MNLNPTENQIQKQRLEYLTARGHFVWRNNSGVQRASYGGKERFVRFGKVGSADIIGIVKQSGRFLAVEVKRPGGKLTPEQKEFFETVRFNGGLSVVAFSVEDVINAGL